MRSVQALTAVYALACAVGAERYLPNYCNNDYDPSPLPLVEGATLKQVTTLHRHGDRVMWQGGQCWDDDNMVGDFECRLESGTAVVERGQEGGLRRIFHNEYAAKEAMPYSHCYVGQLTHKGRVMQNASGRALRRAYVDSGFLSETYDPKEIYLRADAVPRVVQSLEALMEGLFPATASNCTLEHVILHTMETEVDPIFDVAGFCPRAKVYDDYEKSHDDYNEAKRAFAKRRDAVFARLHARYGANVNPNHIWDCMCVHLCHGYDTPSTHDADEDEKALFDELEAVFARQSELQFSFPTVQDRAKVGFGIVLAEWERRWSAIVDAGATKQTQSDPLAVAQGKHAKFAEYSGHDTTVISALTALGFTDVAWPRYSTLLQFELYERSGAYFVRMVHNFRAVALPFCASSSDADLLCPYEKVRAYLISVSPSNQTEDCKITDVLAADANTSAPSSALGMALLVAVGTLAGVATGVAGALYCTRHSQWACTDLIMDGTPSSRKMLPMLLPFKGTNRSGSGRLSKGFWFFFMLGCAGFFVLGFGLGNFTFPPVVSLSRHF